METDHWDENNFFIGILIQLHQLFLGIEVNSPIETDNLYKTSQKAYMSPIILKISSDACGGIIILLIGLMYLPEEECKMHNTRTKDDTVALLQDALVIIYCE